VAFLLEEKSQLAQCRRLARPLKAHKHDPIRDVRYGNAFATLSSKCLRQLFVENLDHLVTGRDTLEDLLLQACLTRLCDKQLDNSIVDIGAKQTQLDLGERCINVSLRQQTLAAQSIEDPTKRFLYGFEHSIYLQLVAVAVDQLLEQHLQLFKGLFTFRVV